MIIRFKFTQIIIQTNTEHADNLFDQLPPMLAHVFLQVEGAAAEDGRTPSIWDTCAHNG